MASRWATRTRKDYLSWLGLVSHEFFHTWNVKPSAGRAWPVQLRGRGHDQEPVDRRGDHELLRPIARGRAGLCTIEEFLEGDPPPPGPSPDRPRNDIETLQETPGRRVQTLEAASYDAWIKFYRRDENTQHVDQLLHQGGRGRLPARRQIRRATDGGELLDDVMRLAFLILGEKGFTPEGFRPLAEEVAGVDLGDWFRKALQSTEELDYREAMDWFGLRFKPADGDDGPGSAWHGMDLGGSVVSRVPRGTPGARGRLRRRRRAAGDRRPPPRRRRLVAGRRPLPAERDGRRPARPPRPVDPPPPDLRSQSPPAPGRSSATPTPATPRRPAAPPGSARRPRRRRPATEPTRPPDPGRVAFRHRLHKDFLIRLVHVLYGGPGSDKSTSLFWCDALIREIACAAAAAPPSISDRV